MNSLVNSMCLLNSSYSKEKIESIFKEEMQKGNIYDYILLSNIVQSCTVFEIESPETLSLRCGNHDVIFKYKKKSNSLPNQDIEVIIGSFIIAIENSVVYKDIMIEIASKENNEYPNFNSLVKDIGKEIQLYDRYGTNFCVAKISIEDGLLRAKLPLRIKSYLESAKTLVRDTDKIYRDVKNVYILFKNTEEDTLDLIYEKLKSNLPDSDIGIAKWDSSYVIVDLFSEIDNFMFMKKEAATAKRKSVEEELNKALNKSLHYGYSLTIVKTDELSIEDKEKVVFSFSSINKEFSAIKNCKKKGHFSYVYNFKGDEFAEDILRILKETKYI